MDSPDETRDAALPDETVAPSTSGRPRIASLPPADPPVYRPRSLPVVWAFLAAFLLAAAATLLAWLLLR